MFRLDFVSASDTLTVLHSVSDTDGLDIVSISPEEISSEDYFVREPRRIEVEVFSDSWIDQYILSGSYEFSRYISQFETRIYREGILFFSGIIDASFLTYDAASDTVHLVLYDRLRLFSVFSDVSMLFALTQGYHPGYCFAYMCQRIMSAVPINIQSVWSGSYSPLSLSVSDLHIMDMPFKEFLRDPQSSLGGSYSSHFSYGFVERSGRAELWFIRRESQDGGDGLYKPSVFARKWIFYHPTCPFLDEIASKDVESSDWLTWDQNTQFFQSTLQDYVGSPATSLQVGSCSYSIPSVLPADYFITQYYDPVTAPISLPVTFTGDPIPTNLYPKGFYDQKGEQTECLKVLKAALLIHNLTIVSSISGVLSITGKGDISGNTVQINEYSVTDFSLKRIDRSQPDLSDLNILLGDTSSLQAVLSSYYDSFLSQIWEAEITIDDLSAYTISLFDVIVLRGKSYKVTRLLRDIINDQFVITGWQL